MARTSPRIRFSALVAACCVLAGAFTWVGGGASAGPLDGSWTPESPAGKASQRYDAAMAYHPGSDKLVLFGGHTSSASPPLGDTWVWDGSTWADATPAVSPPARFEASMATDPQGRVLLFGGRDGGGNPLADTWLWDGAAWYPGPAPPPGLFPRFDAAMAGDGARVVLFSGTAGGSPYFADTWQWDGSSWTKISDPPAASPPAHTGSVMDYHTASGKIVLYSETDGSTWTLTGSTWERAAAPEGSPPDRSDTAMARDDATGRLVLNGGAIVASTGPGDTWTWDGTGWTAQAPPVNPPPRSKAAMAYHGGSQRVVLFGGAVSHEVPFLRLDRVPLDDTWTWDGTGSTAPSVPTTQIPSTTVPPTTIPAVTVPSTTTSSSTSSTTTTTRPLRPPKPPVAGPPTGDTWVHQSPPAPPRRRQNHTMAYFPPTGETVLFGGVQGGFTDPPGSRDDIDIYGSLVFGDTWVWNGSGWREITPPAGEPSPSPRIEAAMAYDPVSRKLVLFGGGYDARNLTGPTPEDPWRVLKDDTWTWDGQRWEEVTDRASPGPRRRASNAAAVTYRGTFGEGVLMFGGAVECNFFHSTGQICDSEESGYEFRDSWLWEGATGRWRQIYPENPPPRRADHSMDWDDSTGTVVLFGGGTNEKDVPDTDSFGHLFDTWRLEGTAWRKVDTPIHPPGAGEPTMAFDRRSCRVVVFGNEEEDAELPGIGNQTWTFNGATSTWKRQFPLASPALRSESRIATDRNSVVLFGGRKTDDTGDQGQPRDAPQVDETWTYEHTLGPLRPRLSVADASVAEGDSGTADLTFTVSLSAASDGPVFAHYSASDRTATAGSDYIAVSGRVDFAPGETTKTVTVAVAGDELSEPDEQFALTLSEPCGADLDRAAGTGTIVDDDEVAVAVTDATVAEGDSGTTTARLGLSLSRPTYRPVAVSYATADGAARAGADYVPGAGVVTIAAGDRTAAVEVEVAGDTEAEGDESLFVDLSATGAEVPDPRGAVTIADDDVASGPPDDEARRPHDEGPGPPLAAPVVAPVTPSPPPQGPPPQARGPQAPPPAALPPVPNNAAPVLVALPTAPPAPLPAQPSLQPQPQPQPQPQQQTQQQAQQQTQQQSQQQSQQQTQSQQQAQVQAQVGLMTQRQREAQAEGAQVAGSAGTSAATHLASRRTIPAAQPMSAWGPALAALAMALAHRRPGPQRAQARWSPAAARTRARGANRRSRRLR